MGAQRQVGRCQMPRNGAWREKTHPHMSLRMMSQEVDYSALSKPRDYWLQKQLSNFSWSINLFLMEF